MKTKKLPYIFAIIFATTLANVTAYALLDAFVLSSAAVVVNEKDTVCEYNPDIPSVKDIITTDNTYTSSATATTVYKQISIETKTVNGATYYIVDIKLSHPSYFKTAFAKDTYGKNIVQYTSTIAKNHKAIVAINGDYYGYRNTGLVIRNGMLYRDNPRTGVDNKALIMDKYGDLKIIVEGDQSGQALIDQGVLQAWSFGPVLVENGFKQDTSKQNWVSDIDNPRVGVGQIGPLHYLFIVVDGRSSSSKGVTLPELAQLFIDHNAQVAYNLDGGGSATLFFNNVVYNKPTYDGTGVYQRGVSDILYIIGD
jgi:exopolysaccharide biosynthesis protein